MPNPNPTEARAAADASRRDKAKGRRAANEKPGELADVRATLWKALGRVEEMTADTDKGLALKATHALVQVAGVYLKVLEVGEMEARLAELEARLAQPSGDGQSTPVPSLTRA
ncbi:MAG TPA: hypothetical protein VK610_08485 [Rhodothermales bacterium]|nr:hypothetical protein [Rhodothermales bacterium]